MTNQAHSVTAVLREQPELMEKVRAASNNEDVVAILAAAGIDVSMDDVAGMSFLENSDATDSLSDEALQAAAGGRRHHHVIQLPNGRFAPGV